MTTSNRRLFMLLWTIIIGLIVICSSNTGGTVQAIRLPPSNHGVHMIASIKPLTVTATEVIKEEFHPRSLVHTIQRLPVAIRETFESSLKAFLSTAVILLPVGLLWNIMMWYRVGFKPWIVEGSKLGIEWGRISAVYAGGDTFAERIRGKDDKWNAYFGSGVASAIMRIEEGPLAMLQGFVSGFAIVYVFEMMLQPQAEPRPDPIAAGSSSPSARSSTTRTVHGRGRGQGQGQQQTHTVQRHNQAQRIAAHNYSPYKGMPTSKYYGATAAAAASTAAKKGVTFF